MNLSLIKALIVSDKKEVTGPLSAAQQTEGGAKDRLTHAFLEFLGRKKTPPAGQVIESTLESTIESTLENALKENGLNEGNLNHSSLNKSDLNESRTKNIPAYTTELKIESSKANTDEAAPGPGISDDPALTYPENTVPVTLPSAPTVPPVEEKTKVPLRPQRWQEGAEAQGGQSMVAEPVIGGVLSPESGPGLSTLMPPMIGDSAPTKHVSTQDRLRLEPLVSEPPVQKVLAQGQEPSAREKEPSAREKEPSAREKEPSALAQKISAQGQEPSVRETEPLALAQKIPAQEKEPLAPMQPVSAQDKETSAQANQVLMQEQDPPAQEQHALAQEQASSAQGHSAINPTTTNQTTAPIHPVPHDSSPMSTLADAPLTGHTATAVDPMQKMAKPSESRQELSGSYSMPQVATTGRTEALSQSDVSGHPSPLSSSVAASTAVVSPSTLAARPLPGMGHETLAVSGDGNTQDSVAALPSPQGLLQQLAGVQAPGTPVPVMSGTDVERLQQLSSQIMAAIDRSRMHHDNRVTIRLNDRFMQGSEIQMTVKGAEKGADISIVLNPASDAVASRLQALLPDLRQALESRLTHCTVQCEMQTMDPKVIAFDERLQRDKNQHQQAGDEHNRKQQEAMNEDDDHEL